MRTFFLLLFLLVSSSAYAAQVTGLTVDVHGDTEHVSIRLSGKVLGKVFTVDNPPPRVVVDLPATTWRGKVELPQDYQGNLIKAVRFGFHTAATGRLVLDLSSDAKPHNIRLIGGDEEGSYWLEFDLTGHGVNIKEDNSRREKHSEREEDSFWHASDKPVIVIDAGHGGQDPGTSGHAGTLEKNITLSYARALKNALLSTGRYKVFLTREDDRYLFLRDRVKLARKVKGSLFISLHADSAPGRQTRGLSVYTISETASDKESEALAAKENKADVIGGMDLSDTSQDVADILIDLAQRETRAKSTQFADLAVRNLGHEVKLLSHTHRFAGFAVLKAPDIPSVLVELGFLTTPREEKMLKSPPYQSKVVRGLVKAIDSYFAKHKK